ncbi:MAG: hypothetical protein R3F59_18340 [Myxococcota bacterium]
MEPRVGILTFGQDPHGHLVMKKIRERHGLWCCLIPTDEIAQRGGLTWSSSPAEPATLPTLDGTVDLRTLDALWYRRTVAKQPLPEGVDPTYAAHVGRSTEGALDGLLDNAFRGRWVSHPLATRRAENKLVQLQAAQRVGLRIPATLVSQDPERIRTFCGAHPGAVLKPLASPQGTEIAATARVGQALLERDDVLSVAPTIYQECIEGERHLRISVVGDRCEAALIEAEALDWRMDLTVPFSAFALDRALEDQLRAVLRELGLAMGILDLKLTDDGPVFLEVNAQGQFLFVEALCGLPLADTVADFLAAQALQDWQVRRPLSASA